MTPALPQARPRRLSAWLFLLAFALPFTSSRAGDCDYFGVCAHPQYSTDYVNEIDRIIASGVKWIRIGPGWASIETSKGVYDAAFLQKLDYIVDTCVSNGVQLDFILCYTAPWASSNPTSSSMIFYKPANWADWEDYVAFITQRYQGKIKHWEVWNEPDSAGFWANSVADYGTLLQKAYVEIKATDPTNQVLLGGLACPNGTAWFNTLLSQGAGTYLDIINYHAYGYAKGNTTVMDKLYADIMTVVNAYPGQLAGKKIWITETGYTTAGNSAEEALKAEAVDSIYALHKRYANIERLFYYSYRATNTGNASEDNFGLTTQALVPLKALPFLQSTIGAASDFALQEAFPSLTGATLPLTYYKFGDGKYLTYDGTSMSIQANTYMYFRLSDLWLHDTNGGLDTTAYVDVTYLDAGTSAWGLQYDGTAANYQTLAATRTNTGTWKTRTFTLTDAKFANRQNWASDFRLYTITSALSVKSVVVRKQKDSARIILGATDRFTLVTRPDSTNPYDEAYNPVQIKGGLESRQITDIAHYIYLCVSEGVAKKGDTNVKIRLTYWDEGTDVLGIQYNSTTGDNYKSYRITKTNTLQWKTTEVILSDANFGGLQNRNADLRLVNFWVPGTNLPEYIRKVEISRL